MSIKFWKKRLYKSLLQKRPSEKLKKKLQKLLEEITIKKLALKSCTLEMTSCTVIFQEFCKSFKLFFKFSKFRGNIIKESHLYSCFRPSKRQLQKLIKYVITRHDKTSHICRWQRCSNKIWKFMTSGDKKHNLIIIL